MSSAAAAESVIDMNVQRSKKFLADMKTNPFIAVVVYADGVRVFTKDIEPEHIASIEAALGEALAERMQDDAGT